MSGRLPFEARIAQVRHVLDKLAEDLDAQGYVFEGARVRGFCAGFTCEHERDEPLDATLAGQYLLGVRIGGEFFFRYSLPTMLRMPALTP